MQSLSQGTCIVFNALRHLVFGEFEEFVYQNVLEVFFLIVLHLSRPLVCIFAKAISDCKQYVR